MLDAMQAFRLLMNAHQVKYYRACATSAMREAINGDAIVKMVKEKTTIQIEVIDGKEEAAIIAATDLHSIIQKSRVYLYVDVGGGSTECTLYDQGKVKTSKSFKIGTVRILNNLVSESTWKSMSKWITNETKTYSKVTVIGSGGNINKIIKMSGRKSSKSLSYLNLLNFHEKLNSLSYDERVVKLGLNPDRADVIIPALQIYLRTMKWSRAEQIIVPSIGLSDGIIKSLYKSK